MRMLVVYGSKRGGTQGLAEMIATDAGALGVDVTLADTRKAPPPTGFDGVIVCGALYASRWHRAARRFVRRNSKELRRTAVWFVSSGPLDGSAEDGDIPPVPQVRKLMERVGARGHMTFGGRLAPDAHGFPASAMAKTRSGDWRDAEHVRSWTAERVAEAEQAA